jgi:putative oxidoreductase
MISAASRWLRDNFRCVSVKSDGAARYRNVLKRLARSSRGQSDVGLLVLRLWFGLAMALSHGVGKMSNFDGFAKNVAGMGLPAPGLMALAAAGSELLGGLLLAVGLLTRPAAASVLATMLVAAFYVHADDPFGKKEFALAYAAAALVVLIAGPGKLSLDARLFDRSEGD